MTSSRESSLSELKELREEELREREGVICAEVAGLCKKLTLIKDLSLGNIIYLHNLY